MLSKPASAYTVPIETPGKDFDRTQLTESQNVASVELHRDTNDNERFDFLTSGRSADAPYYAPYIVSGDTVIEKGPVIDVAVVAVGETVREAKGIGPTPTGTAMAAGAEPTREVTAVRTQANAGAPIRTATTEESGGSGPGFGALIAIIAILSALVLAWRV